MLFGSFKCLLTIEHFFHHHVSQNAVISSTFSIDFTEHTQSAVVVRMSSYSNLRVPDLRLPLSRTVVRANEKDSGSVMKVAAKYNVLYRF